MVQFFIKTALCEVHFEIKNGFSIQIVNNVFLKHIEIIGLIPPFNQNFIILENDDFSCGNLRPLAGLHLAVAEHHARRDDLLGLGAGIHHVAGFQ